MARKQMMFVTAAAALSLGAYPAPPALTGRRSRHRYHDRRHRRRACGRRRRPCSRGHRVAAVLLRASPTTGGRTIRRRPRATPIRNRSRSSSTTSRGRPVPWILHMGLVSLVRAWLRGVWLRASTCVRLPRTCIRLRRTRVRLRRTRVRLPRSCVRLLPARALLRAAALLRRSPLRQAHLPLNRLPDHVAALLLRQPGRPIPARVAALQRGQQWRPVPGRVAPLLRRQQCRPIPTQ